MPFALQRLSVQLWTALADEAQRAIGAASRSREGPRGYQVTYLGGRTRGTWRDTDKKLLARCPGYKEGETGVVVPLGCLWSALD